MPSFRQRWLTITTHKHVGFFLNDGCFDKRFCFNSIPVCVIYRTPVRITVCVWILVFGISSVNWPLSALLKLWSLPNKFLVSLDSLSPIRSHYSKLPASTYWYVHVCMLDYHDYATKQFWIIHKGHKRHKIQLYCIINIINIKYFMYILCVILFITKYYTSCFIFFCYFSTLLPKKKSLNSLILVTL